MEKQDKINKRQTYGTEDTGQKASTHDSSTKQEEVHSPSVKITKEILQAFENSTKQSLNQRIEKYLVECDRIGANDEELMRNIKSDDEDAEASQSYESEEESFNRGASPNTQIKRGFESTILAHKKRPGKNQNSRY